MKRYKLKIDIPAYKCGERFHLSKKGNLVHTKSGRLAYPKNILKEYPSVPKDWFEEIPEEPKTVYDLEYGDKCWMRDVNLQPLQIEWRGTPYDNQLRELELIFLSKEELEKDNIRRKAKKILKRDTKGFKPDWSNRSQEKYIVYFDHDWGRLAADFWCTYHSQPSLYFATRADAEASIKAHEKEWKTYLGVEE